MTKLQKRGIVGSAGLYLIGAVGAARCLCDPGIAARRGGGAVLVRRAVRDAGFHVWFLSCV